MRHSSLHILKCVAALALSVVAVASNADDLQDGKAAHLRQDFTEAMRRLLPAANAGNAEAQRLVGEMSFRGQGVKPNKEAAFRWNELAAHAGDSIAQFNLGYMYQSGLGATMSATSAVLWYEKAALQGYVPAQLRLGDLYAASPGSRGQAIYWYDQARKNGDEAARAKFADLSRIQAADVRAADARTEKEVAAYELKERQEQAEQQAKQDAWERMNKAAESQGPSYSEQLIAQARRNAAQTTRDLAALNHAASTGQTVRPSSTNSRLGEGVALSTAGSRGAAAGAQHAPAAPISNPAKAPGSVLVAQAQTPERSVPRDVPGAKTDEPKAGSSAGEKSASKGSTKLVREAVFTSPDFKTEQAARAVVAESFKNAMKALDYETRMGTRRARFVSAEEPKCAHPNPMSALWGCSLGYVLEVPDSVSTGATVSK